MFLQGRVIIVWLSWLVGGVCGVVILLIIICYCRLMPRHQKSFDEQYLKENYTIKENQTYSYHDSYKVKHAEVQARPASYAGRASPPRRAAPAPAPRRAPLPDPPPQYASSSSDDAATASSERADTAPTARLQRAASEASTTEQSDGVLDEVDCGAAGEALKTRSLPASVRTRGAAPAPAPAPADRHHKMSLSKKYKNRMRSEHAAIIALSRSRGHLLDADAVIVYDQRTQL